MENVATRAPSVEPAPQQRAEEEAGADDGSDETVGVDVINEMMAEHEELLGVQSYERANHLSDIDSNLSTDGSANEATDGSAHEGAEGSSRPDAVQERSACSTLARGPLRHRLRCR